MGEFWSHQKNVWLDNNGGTFVWIFLLLFVDHYFVWNERRRRWILELVFDMFEWIDDASWLPKPNFHKFMVDAKSANYNAICKVYNGHPNAPLEDKEHTCFYTLVRKLMNPHKELDTFCFYEDHINLCRCGYNSQSWRNLKWTMQGLKLDEMILGQQFLPMFLNFNNGYVGGLISQHIWLITLWMNLTLRRKLWCQQPILLRVSIPPCGFLFKMVTKWK